MPSTSCEITPYELLVGEVNKIQALDIFLSCQLKLLEKNRTVENTTQLGLKIERN